MDKRIYRLYKHDCGNDYDSDPYHDDSSDNESDYEFEQSDNKNYLTLTRIRMKDPSYNQLLQISISTERDSIKTDEDKPTDDKPTEEDGFCIVIDKSVDKNIFYIYMPPSGKEYIFPIDPSLTFQSLLDHILYSTNEFIEKYKHGVRYEFVLEKLFDCDENYTSETFLKIPLDSIPIAQGNIVVKNVL